MKKIVLWLLTIMVVAFLAGFVVLQVSGSNIIDGMFGKKTQINEEKNVSLQGVNTLSIKTVNPSIKITPTDENEIRVHFYGSVNGNRTDNKLETGVSGDTLSIEVTHKKPSFAIFDLASDENLKLDIYLPRKYSGNLQGSTVSGNLNISGLRVADLVASSNSGDVILNNLKAAKADITNTSGMIDSNGLVADTTIGNVSGEVKGSFKELASSISIKSTSGDTDLALPQSAGFKVNFQTVSGDFSSMFPEGPGSSDKKNVSFTNGDGRTNITVSSVSGSLKVSKN